jgi:YD repeat-containing protein
MTSSEFVAQFDKLATAPQLAKVNLSDTKVLAVSTLQTLDYIVQHYQAALTKVVGGYSFVITTTGANWQEDKTYDAAGKLTATTDTSFLNGVRNFEQTLRTDGSTLSIRYAAGKIIESIDIAAGGKKTTTSFDAATGFTAWTKAEAPDGTTISTNYTNGQPTATVTQSPSGESTTETLGTGSARTVLTVTADGTRTTLIYDTSGALSHRTIVKADGSGEAIAYDLKDLGYTQQQQFFDKTGKVTAVVRLHADGTLAATENYGANGAKAYGTYDAAGHLIATTRTEANGAASTLTYNSGGAKLSWIVKDANGTTTTRLYDPASGALTHNTVVHADGSGESIAYGMKGFSYTEQHQYFDATGKVTAVVRYHADGTLDSTENYGANGAKAFSIYDAAGHLISTRHVDPTTPVPQAPESTTETGDGNTGVPPQPHAPTVTHAIADQSSAEDAKWSFQVPSNTFGDADGDVLSYSAKLADGSSLPSWLTFSAATRSFTGTPPLNFSGAIDLVVTASDGDASVADTFRLTVTPVNDAPVITSDGGGAQAAVSIAEHTTAVTTVAASDVDAGAALTYAIAGGADAAKFTIDPATGELALKVAPSFALPGDAGGNNVFNVTVSASDGALSVQQSLAVSVTEVSSAPVFAGTQGSDDFTATTAANWTLSGFGGNDRLTGGAGDDVIDGGAGNDFLAGGAGIDTVSYASAGAGVTVSLAGGQATGGGGTDTLAGFENIIGSNFADTLVGSAADNDLNGGAGNDWLVAGRGADVLVGGSGADRFVLQDVLDSTNAARDYIRDFDRSQGDLIDLSAIDAISSRASRGDDHFAFSSGGHFTGRAGQLIANEVSADHYLVQGDLNGDRAADFSLWVDSVAVLTASSFIL